MNVSSMTRREGLPEDVYSVEITWALPDKSPNPLIQIWKDEKRDQLCVKQETMSPERGVGSQKRKPLTYWAKNLQRHW